MHPNKLMSPCRFDYQPQIPRKGSRYTDFREEIAISTQFARRCLPGSVGENPETGPAATGPVRDVDRGDYHRDKVERTLKNRKAERTNEGFIISRSPISPRVRWGPPAPPLQLYTRTGRRNLLFDRSPSSSSPSL